MQRGRSLASAAPVRQDERRDPGRVPLRTEGEPVFELSDEELAVVELVRDWVDREVKPVASELEHADRYPEALIEQIKQMGIFGLAIGEPWNEAGVSAACYAAVTEELAVRYVEEVTDPITGERFRFEADTATGLEAAVEEWLASSAAP